MKNLDYCKTYYVKNREYMIQRVKDRKKETYSILLEYKKSLSCTDCGISFREHPEILDFDHLSGKEMDVSQMPNRGCSWERIIKEIAKCEPVCANCHRIRTTTRYRKELENATNPGRRSHSPSHEE